MSITINIESIIKCGDSTKYPTKEEFELAVETFMETVMRNSEYSNEEINPAEKFLKSDLKELNQRINPIQTPSQGIGYRTSRSSLEVLLDMVVYQSQLSTRKVLVSKEEFLKVCIDRLSFSYDALKSQHSYIPKNQ